VLAKKPPSHTPQVKEGGELEHGKPRSGEEDAWWKKKKGKKEGSLYGYIHARKGRKGSRRSTIKKRHTEEKGE